MYVVQNPGAAQRPGGSERFRQSQLINQQTPTSVGIPASAGHPQALGSYMFPPGQYAAPQMQGTTLQYQHDYIQDPPRQQQFSSYPSQMMHGVSQHAQPQASYDSLPQYQSRQSAAIDQFGVPQYYPGESTNASVPASMPQQYGVIPYQHQLPNQSSSMNRSALPPTYAPAMTGFTPVEPPLTDDPPTESWEREYEQRLRETNQDISNGTLGQAAPKLMELSQWLLGRVGEFGLNVDVVGESTEVHDARVNMWTEFNLCWLALLQRQKENTEQMAHLNQPLVPSETLLSTRFLEEMGTELVRLCDSIERHGLVDYEMGVAEEEIINILTECLDLLPSDDEAGELDAAAGPAVQT